MNDRIANRCRLVGSWLLPAALCALLGCGSADAPQPSGRAMSAVPLRSAESEGNHPPRIEHIQILPSPARARGAIRAVVRASDPDGDALRFEYEWRIDGRRVPGTGATLDATSSLRKGSRIEVSVVASDGRLESDAASEHSWIENQPPVLQAVALSVDGIVEPGTELFADPRGSDPDGDELDYQYTWLVNERPIEATERTLPIVGLKRGDAVRVRVTASDGTETSRSVRSSEVRVGNAPPVILGVPTARVDEGVYRYAFDARDPDGDRNLRFKLARAPTGMTIDPVLGVAIWRPSVEQVGTHAVEVVVDDGHGASTALRFDLHLKEEIASVDQEG